MNKYIKSLIIFVFAAVTLFLSAAMYEVHAYLSPDVHTEKFTSIAGQDGAVAETAFGSNRYVTQSSASYAYVGEDQKTRRSKTIFSFDTSSLPDNVNISKVTLKFFQKGYQGDPESNGTMEVAIKKWFFGSSTELLADDYASFGTVENYFSFAPKKQTDTEIRLEKLHPYDINTIGTTQFRIRQYYYSANGVADGIIVSTGDNGDVNQRPELTVEYYLPVESPAKDQYRVFVTSQSYDGNLGGYKGADMKCQQAADAKGLGGVWMAWLTDYFMDADTRFTHGTKPYVLLDNTKIAENWQDLIDQNLNHEINFSENMDAVNSTSGWNVWTNTSSRGNIYNTQTKDTCENFSSNNSGLKMTSGGSTSQKDWYWTEYSNIYRGCDSLQHLYCFEQ